MSTKNILMLRLKYFSRCPVPCASVFKMADEENSHFPQQKKVCVARKEMYWLFKTYFNFNNKYSTVSFHKPEVL